MKYVWLCSRIVWRIAALAIVLLAVVVTLGREFAPKLKDYQAWIDETISRQLNLRVESQQLWVDWSGFSPRLTVAQVNIFAEDEQQPVLSAEGLKAHPDFLGSMLNWGWGWQELSVERLSMQLMEREDGSWTLAGLPEQRGQTDAGRLLDMIQRSTYLKIDEAVLPVQFFSGETAVVRLRNMLVENSGTFHRLDASVAFEDAAESARLIIEGEGDLLDFNGTVGTAYLKLQRLNFQGPVSALLKRWLPAIAQQKDFEAAVETELWLRKNRDRELRLSGYLSAAEIPLLGYVDAPPITDVKAEITGDYRPGEAWRVTLQGIDFQWPEWEIEPLTLSYQQDTGDPLGFGTISVDHLNLATLSQLLQSNRLLPEKGLQALASLRPRGSITAAHLHISPGEQGDAPRISLQANLHDVAIDSWKKAPAGRKINGFIDIQGKNGLLELDSPDGFEMYYPTAYDDYMVHPSARGQLTWRIDSEAGAIRVASGPIQIKGKKGDSGDGVVYLSLDLPLNKAHGPGEMFLQVGLRDSHSRHRNNFIPRTLNPNLLRWLDDAIGATAVPEAGFIWRGSLAKKAIAKRSIQLYLKTQDGHLTFRPDWPALKQLDALITVDGGNVLAQVDRARLGDVDVGATAVRVRKVDDGLLLSVKGGAGGDAGAALQVLAQSPLQSRVAGLVNWRLQGSTEVDVDLSIPLEDAAVEPSYRVDARIADATLADPSGKFVFNQLRGNLRYRDKTGLTGEALQGVLWDDNPIAGVLTTSNDAVVLDLHGTVAVDQLLSAPNLKQLVAGNTDYRAEVVVAPGQPVHLDINSSLEGVALGLPQPFGKPATEVSDFHLGMAFGDDMTLVRASHKQQLNAVLEVAEGKLINGVLGINKPVALEPGRGELRLDGLLHNFTLDDWLPFYQRNLSEGIGGNNAPLPIRATLKIDNFIADRLTLRDVSLSGSHTEGSGNGWQFSFASDIAVGEVALPRDATMPLKVDLQSLDLPSPGDKKETLFADINPTELPYLDFNVDKLTVGEDQYGSLSFLLQPLDNGAELRNIHGELLGLKLGIQSSVEDGEPEIDEETRLLWVREDGESRSRFSGVIAATDVADFLANFGEPKIIDSSQATFITDLSWRGAPDQIGLESLTGSLVLELEDGEFYRSPKGATNAVIRVVGLFNFANWVRRLKLDFSDLFAKGMTYDNIRGGLRFADGTMTFDAPIVVKMPSGRMKWSGSADLLGEQLDAYLVLTVPVGTNLPWLVALAGGLPAAAGVYLTSKLFEKQLDKLSSLGYEVTGSWDDPEIKVDRIFSDKAEQISASEQPAATPELEPGPNPEPQPSPEPQ